MATLEAALHRAAEGTGQVVGVVGEAGVGKSRLCDVFVEQVRTRNRRPRGALPGARTDRKPPKASNEPGSASTGRPS